MQASEIDPEQFFAKANNMSKEEMLLKTVSQETGLESMDVTNQRLAGKGQANEEKFYNLPEGMSKGQAA